MNVQAIWGASLLLAVASSTIAAPLTFTLLEGNAARRDKFEKHFVTGSALKAIEIGKKRVPLPEGNWVISEASTHAPDVTEEGTSQVLGDSADAWLSLEDAQSGDVINVETSLSAFNPDVSFTRLIGACQPVARQQEKDWITLGQQQDSVREDRQSCVRTQARLLQDKGGEKTVLLVTALVESWKADYIQVEREHQLPLTEGQTLESVLQQPAVRAYVAAQQRWSSQVKADIARQMGW